MRRKKHNAFTLVELLVVISIVALLISLLLPVLGKARDVAQDMVCLSNLRQIGIASTIYSQDSDDWVLRAKKDNVQWDRNPLFRDNLNLDNSPGAGTFPKELLCPRADYGHSLSSSSTAGISRFYGMNDEHVRRFGTYSSNYNTKADFRREDVVDPQRKYYILDALNWEVTLERRGQNYWRFSDEWTVNNAPSTLRVTSYRHDFNCNILYFDMHVETTAQRDVWASGLKDWLYNR